MNKQTKQMVELLFEVGTLKKIVRSHRQRFLTDDLSDNIASHSFRVAIIGYFLACMEQADVLKVVTMCLFHDISETRSGDLNWVHKKYVTVDEEKITKDQLHNICDNNLHDTIYEYKERLSLESKIAKDADNLDQAFLIREYAWMGNKEAQIWEDAKTQEKMLYTKSASKLYKSLYKVSPNEWAHTK